MNFKTFAQIFVVAALSMGLAAACAPKKKGKRTPVVRADGKPASGAPSAETIDGLVSKALKGTYKMDDASNKEFARRFLGASLKMSDEAKDKSGKVGSAKVRFESLFASPVEAVIAEGEVNSTSEMRGMSLYRDNCGRELKGYAVEARCTGVSCDNVLVMIRDTNKSVDKKNVEMLVLFMRGKKGEEFKLKFAASEAGVSSKTGSTKNFAAVLEDFKAKKITVAGQQVELKDADINVGNMICSKPADPTRPTAGSGAPAVTMVGGAAAPTAVDIEDRDQGVAMETAAATLAEQTRVQQEAASRAGQAEVPADGTAETAIDIEDHGMGESIREAQSGGSAADVAAPAEVELSAGDIEDRDMGESFREAQVSGPAAPAAASDAPPAAVLADPTQMSDVHAP